MLNKRKLRARRRSHIHPSLLLSHLARWEYHLWCLLVSSKESTVSIVSSGNNFDGNISLASKFFCFLLVDCPMYYFLNTQCSEISSGWPTTGKWWVLLKWSKEVCEEVATEAGEAGRKNSREQKKKRSCICSSHGLILELLRLHHTFNCIYFISSLKLCFATAGTHDAVSKQICWWQEWCGCNGHVVKGNWDDET